MYIDSIYKYTCRCTCSCTGACLCRCQYAHVHALVVLFPYVHVNVLVGVFAYVHVDVLVDVLYMYWCLYLKMSLLDVLEYVLVAVPRASGAATISNLHALRALRPFPVCLTIRALSACYHARSLWTLRTCMHFERTGIAAISNPQALYLNMYTY